MAQPKRVADAVQGLKVSLIENAQDKLEQIRAASDMRMPNWSN